MGGSKQPSHTTQTTKTDPWIGQQPHLINLYNQASNIPGRQYYPGAGTVGTNPNVEHTLREMWARGGGSAEEASARAHTNQVIRHGIGVNDIPTQFLRDTASGKYLHGGAGFNAALDAANRANQARISSQFGGGGRFGSGLHRTAETQALGDSFAGLYGQERQHQEAAGSLLPQLALQGKGMDVQARQAAANLVPQLSALDMQNLKLRQGVGDYITDRDQDRLDADRQRWEFLQNAPYDRLGFISSIIQGGNPGSQTSSTGPNPNRRSRFASGLGGAATGAGIGTAIMPGFGTAIGAGLGALGGLLF